MLDLRTRPSRLAALLALALAAIAWLAAGPATASAHPGPDRARPGETPDLRRAREATRAFRDVDAARAAGYAATGPCAEDPKYGGMGIHYANPALIADGELDVTKPEILVADQDLATDTDRPSLFGMPFDGPMLGHDADMPIHYDLHVWLYRHNPAGQFAMWNPRVHCPDGAR